MGSVKGVVWNEVMETYLIQQAHVGKPRLASVKTELRSTVLRRGGTGRALGRALRAVCSSVQMLKIAECLYLCEFSSSPVHFHHLNLKTKQKPPALQSLLFKNNKTCNILIKVVFVTCPVLLG